MISKMSMSVNVPFVQYTNKMASGSIYPPKLLVNKQQDAFMNIPPFHLHGFFLSWYLHSIYCPSHTGISDYHLLVMVLVGIYPKLITKLFGLLIEI